MENIVIFIVTKVEDGQIAFVTRELREAELWMQHKDANNDPIYEYRTWGVR